MNLSNLRAAALGLASLTVTGCGTDWNDPSYVRKVVPSLDGRLVLTAIFMGEGHAVFVHRPTDEPSDEFLGTSNNMVASISGYCNDVSIGWLGPNRAILVYESAELTYYRSYSPLDTDVRLGLCDERVSNCDRILPRSKRTPLGGCPEHHA